MYTNPWSDDEYAILCAHFPEHGREWVGWETLLPDRTPAAIGRKANVLGLHEPEKATRKKSKRRRPEPKQYTYTPPGPDPYEKYILACMTAGMTLADIDAKMKWRPGKAKLVLTERWKRLKGYEHGRPQ